MTNELQHNFSTINLVFSLSQSKVYYFPGQKFSKIKSARSDMSQEILQMASSGSLCNSRTFTNTEGHTLKFFMNQNSPCDTILIWQLLTYI